MITPTDVTDPRFQIALSKTCPVCGAKPGYGCNDDGDEFHEERLADNDTGEEG